MVEEADKYKKALKVLGKELSTAAKEDTIHRILVFSETKKGCDEVTASVTYATSDATIYSI